MFRKHFAGFKNHYVLIGGSACDIQMEEAGLDLVEKKKEGLTVKSGDIRKHRLDVFRVFQLLSMELRVQLPEAVRVEVEEFVEAMRLDLPDIRAIGIKTISAEEVLDNIVTIYALNTG